MFVKSASTVAPLEHGQAVVARCRHLNAVVRWQLPGNRTDCVNDRNGALRRQLGRSPLGQISVASDNDKASSTSTPGLAMAKQYLDGSQITRGFVDERRLGSAEGMRAIILRRQSDGRDPLVHQPGVLAGAQAAIGHNTAREGEVIDRAAASLEPGKQATLVSAVISNWTGLPVFC